MTYAVQHLTTREWLTLHNFKPWFTTNKAIRYESDDARYLLDMVKTLPNNSDLMVVEVLHVE